MAARPDALKGATVSGAGRLRRCLLALLLVVPAACTVPVYEPPPPQSFPAEALPPPPQPEPIVVPEPQPRVAQPAPPPPIPPPPPPVSAGATAALLMQGRQQAAAGNYPLATSTLERALRINPNDADIWYELGRVKLDQGDYVQAENMGRRALGLAGSDSLRRALCDELIEAARAGR